MRPSDNKWLDTKVGDSVKITKLEQVSVNLVSDAMVGQGSGRKLPPIFVPKTNYYLKNQTVPYPMQ